MNEVDGGKGEDNKATGGDGNACFETTEGGLAHRLVANGNVLRVVFILHAETTIVSLLNLIVYKGIPVGLLEGNFGDDVLLSLVDYCVRQLVSSFHSDQE